MGALADDILNIPYIDSDNMDEYLKNLADRADELEIKRDKIKQLLNMRYGDPEKHKELWLYGGFDAKPMDIHMDLMDMVRAQKPLSKDVKVANITAEKRHTIITEDEQVTLVENKMIDDANRMIIQIKEDIDNFIFETIQPWCEARIERKISKVDLEQALLMYYSLDKEDPEPISQNMTIDEAILILDCERPYSNRGCGSDVREKEAALIMAIKALKRIKNNETIRTSA